jgi:hypothetical protein
MVGFAPLPTETASSIKKFICQGTASDVTPKIPHFRSVLK